MCKTGKSIYFLSRVQANLSRGEAAERLNISVETIGAYERGETKIPCSLVPRMAVIYDDELLPYQHMQSCPVGCECLPRARREVSNLVRIGIEYLFGQKKDRLARERKPIGESSPSQRQILYFQSYHKCSKNGRRCGMLRYKLVVFDDGKIINQVNFATLSVATDAYEAEKAKGRLADIIDSHKIDRETREKLFPVLAAS